MASVRAQDSVLWAVSHNMISNPGRGGLHMRRHSPKAHSNLGGVAQPLGAHGTIGGSSGWSDFWRLQNQGPEPPSQKPVLAGRVRRKNLTVISSSASSQVRRNQTQARPAKTKGLSNMPETPCLRRFTWDLFCFMHLVRLQCRGPCPSARPLCVPLTDPSL